MRAAYIPPSRPPPGQGPKISFAQPPGSRISAPKDANPGTPETPAGPGVARREEVRQERADSPAAPREPQLRSRSTQLRAGPDTAPAGGGCAAPSSPSEEPFSPAPPPRLQPRSSTAPAASSAPSFRRFF
uniref:Uncharacterized protein n=1 Tax=Suricata suricatta TaxID=37032 RepID=A0A673TQI8_SURSU